MSSLFMTVLNMSITASYVAIAIIIARLLLYKAPKIFSYALWVVLLFRLLCPFTFESLVSLMPANSQPIPQDIIYAENPAIEAGITVIDDTVNTSIQNSLPPVNQTVSVNPMRVIMEFGSIVWIAGILLLLTYGIITFLKLQNKLSISTLVHDDIYETDRISTPFVLGFIKPKIYIPTDLSEDEFSYIVKHEQTHIKRYDYIIKPIAFITLSIHWFNPLIWFSYFLMSKDMEMSCDESVMKNFNEDIRSSYSNSLLSLSAKQSGLLVPLAFGESNVKSRIKNVLDYKKPTLWVIIIAFISVIILIVTLTTNPKVGHDEVIRYVDKANELYPEFKEINNKEDIARINEIMSKIEWSKSNLKPADNNKFSFWTEKKSTTERISDYDIWFNEQTIVWHPATNSYGYITDNKDIAFLKNKFLDNSINKTSVYKNESLGFTIQIPDSWNDKYIIKENENSITIYNKKVYEDVTYGTGGGQLFTLERMVGELITQRDMDQEPVRTDIVLQGNGYTYFVRYPSDVQYPLVDEELSKDYKSMFEQIPEVISNISLLGIKTPVAKNKDYKVIGTSFFNTEIPKEWEIIISGSFPYWNISSKGNNVGIIELIPYGTDSKYKTDSDDFTQEFLSDEEFKREVRIVLFKPYADKKVMQNIVNSFKFTNGHFNIVDLQSNAEIYLAQGGKKIFGMIDGFEISNNEITAVRVKVMKFKPDEFEGQNPNGFSIEDLNTVETYPMDSVNIAPLVPPDNSSYSMYYMPILDLDFLGIYDYKNYFFDFIIGADEKLKIVLGHYVP